LFLTAGADDFALFAKDPGHAFYRSLPRRGRSRVVRAAQGQGFARLGWTLTRAASREGVDALHVQYFAPLGYRRPLVVTVHDLAFLHVRESFPLRLRVALSVLVPRSMARASRIIAVSEFTRRDILERLMPQGPGESSAAYAARLQDAWNTWPWAGTPFGLLRALNATGYTNVVLAQVRGGKQFTLDGTGALVISSTGSWTSTFMADPFWSRFDVIFPQPLRASWVSGGVPASNSGESNFIRSLIALWKPGSATCGRIIIVTAGKVWGSPASQLWGSGVWGGTTTVWVP